MASRKSTRSGSKRKGDGGGRATKRATKKPTAKAKPKGKLSGNGAKGRKQKPEVKAATPRAAARKEVVARPPAELPIPVSTFFF